MKSRAETAVVLFEHSLVRAGIGDLLHNAPEPIRDIIFVEETNQLLQVIVEEHPDIVILNFRLLPDNSVNFILHLRQHSRTVSPLLMCESYPLHLIASLQRAGISGCLSFTATAEEFHLTVSALRAGKSYFPQELLMQLLLSDGGRSEQVIPDILSRRELEVFCHVAGGMPTRNIAQKMELHPKTVNTYRYRVFEKLGVDNNVKLTHLALKHGLVNLGAYDSLKTRLE
ncbi:MAG: response regulator transcription factor [Gammaproteobacteria bacterium]